MVAVTINVDASNLGTTVEQVFAQLSDEDKKELARSIMLEVLTKPQNAERVAEENRFANHLYESYKDSTTHWDKLRSVDEARKSTKFRDHMAKWRSSSERMMEMITQSAITHFKDQVTELVKTDQQLQQRYQMVQQEIINAYPSMVQCALTNFFASQMQQVGFAIQNSDMMRSHINMIGQSIQSQLSNAGLHISVPVAN